MDVTFKHYMPAEVLAYLPLFERTSAHSVRFRAKDMVEASAIMEFVGEYRPTSRLIVTGTVTGQVGAAELAAVRIPRLDVSGQSRRQTQAISSGWTARASASARSIRPSRTSRLSESSSVNEPALRVSVISWCRCCSAFLRTCWRAP